jgi:hypothetical protein
MAFFVLMETTDKKKMLVNLDACVAIGEGEKGEAVAMSIAGVAVPTGIAFATVMSDMLTEQRS